jgi:hypothetical protein
MAAFTPAQLAANRLQSQAAQLQSQNLNFAGNASNILANGIPAQGTTPAVAAADIIAALGANATELQNKLAAFESAGVA